MFCPIQVKHELNFHDKDTQFYRFQDSESGPNHITNEKDSDDELQEGLSLLSQLGPDALLTMILRKWWDCRASTRCFDLWNVYATTWSAKSFL